MEIGSRLKAERQRQGISLRKLAEQIGVTAGLISHIENGRSQPSVSTLYALANNLGLSLDEVLGLNPQARPRRSAERRQVVHRAARHPRLHIASGVTWDLVVASIAGAVDAVRVTYQPGASSSPDGSPMRHDGQENAYLVSGSLVLVLGGRRHVVRAGDSLSFDSTRPHLYVNETDEPAWGLWLNVDRGREPTSR
ncbi:cupin domain-containing protein [Dactylosporangium sp. NPDC005572]|uniref:cupin domain-containing protein n=1 Tax=Dactylosporangium sp. NPDC005572 TaxID=3156889 RepID=UPI0033BA507B